MTVKSKSLSTSTKTTDIGEAIDWGRHADRGTDTNASEVKTPFLKILDAKSKELFPVLTIPGAVAGMILDTNTGVASESINFVPVLREHRYVAWRPIKQGGGKQATYEANDAVVIQAKARLKAKTGKDFGELFDTSGNELIETFYVFGLVADDNNLPLGMAIAIFKSTQIKKWKAMKLEIDRLKKGAPMYSFLYNLSTTVESNTEHSWFGWVPELTGRLTDVESPLFFAASELFDKLEAERASFIVDESVLSDNVAADDTDDF